jgi:2-polyprenyl-3-methyl-5-hydroxy-6-metoxy-1,4-benzoquinol methylase
MPLRRLHRLALAYSRFMAGCCSTDYRKLFNRKFAARDARNFRAHGLRGSSKALVGLAGDVRGASVLDIGGGVGAIGLELLAAGAEHATTVELSAGYDEEAAELAAERGVANRVDRRVADIVEDAGAFEPHDVVVMHRVVCCYPDVDALIGAAADLTRTRLVLTYPQERRWISAGLAVVNAFLRLRRCGFRTYLHPVERIVGLAEQHGLGLEGRVRHGLLWESASLARP